MSEISFIIWSDKISKVVSSGNFSSSIVGHFKALIWDYVRTVCVDRLPSNYVVQYLKKNKSSDFPLTG